MSEFILVITILLLCTVGILIVVVMKSRPKTDGSSDTVLMQMIEQLRNDLRDNSGKSREELQQRLDTIYSQISSHQRSTSDNMFKQHKHSTEVIKDLTQRLSDLENTNKQILSFADQLKSLENILQNPKQRGILGEYFLETLLGHVLQPNQYKMQYRFENGEIVDAAIFFRDKIIPVDAKFSLEKYNKMVQANDKEIRERLEREFKNDVKNRIDETAKYVRAGEGTTDFAFMFVPAEGIYYNLLIYNVGTVSVNTKDLIEYAFRKHVIIVSPTSFYAYLETVLLGLNALEIEDSIKLVMNKIHQLKGHLQSFESYLDKLGSQLGTTVSTYNKASREYKKIDKDVQRITGDIDVADYEVNLLEKPSSTL